MLPGQDMDMASVLVLVVLDNSVVVLASHQTPVDTLMMVDSLLPTLDMVLMVDHILPALHALV